MLGDDDDENDENDVPARRSTRKAAKTPAKALGGDASGIKSRLRSSRPLRKVANGV